MRVDLPTPPFPDPMQITLPTWASAPAGRLPRPSFCCRAAFWVSVSTSKYTFTWLTPSSGETAWTTELWKCPLIGHPGVVSDTVTSTTPLGLSSIERTMSSSTIERCSSGSITDSSARMIWSLPVTAPILANPRPRPGRPGQKSAPASKDRGKK